MSKKLIPYIGGGYSCSTCKSWYEINPKYCWHCKKDQAHNQMRDEKGRFKKDRKKIIDQYDDSNYWISEKDKFLETRIKELEERKG